MAKNISLMGADYPQVPAVQLPQTGGGTATFYDIEVVDNLNSDSSTDALSAKQGKKLKTIIDSTVIFVEIDDVTIEGSTSAEGTTRIDLSNYVPAGYAIWSVMVQLKYSGSYYNLPWINAGSSQYTIIDRIADTAITIRNKTSWGTIPVRVTLICKNESGV